MKKFKCSFTGRTKNAIGIFYPITIIVEAENKEKANLKIYDTHEHLHHLTITEIK